MSVFPVEHANFTEATLLILSAEISDLWRCLYDSRRQHSRSTKPYHALSDEDRRSFIDANVQRLSQKYVTDAGAGLAWVSTPLHIQVNLADKEKGRVHAGAFVDSGF